MRILVTFDAYEREDVKKEAWRFILYIAEQNNWTIEQNGDVNVFWQSQTPCLLIQTQVRKISASDPLAVAAQTYDAKTQLGAVLDALTTNARPGILLDGVRWSFDDSGDVYYNKRRIPAADFEQVISGRLAATTISP